MNAYDFAVSLRVRHPAVSPEEITRELGLQPWHAWKAGDPRRTPRGEPLEGTYRESYWSVQLVEEPRISSEELQLEGFLLRTLGQLASSQEFFKRLQAEGGTVEFAVSVFGQENFTMDFSPALLTAVGRLGFGIALDVNPE